MGIDDYIAMRGNDHKLNEYMRKKHLGSSAEISTRWSVFSKFFKDTYLQLKKKLVS